MSNKLTFLKIVAIFPLILAVAFSDKVIRDLQGVITEENASSWKTINFNGTQKTSTCGNTTILGGYLIFGTNSVMEKIYNINIEHFAIRITITVYFIDSLDSGTPALTDYLWI